MRFDVLARARARLAPPPAQGLADWMEEHMHLPKVVSTESGKVRLYSYQRGIADAISDPTIERVSVMKSARTGLTTLVVGTMGYRAHRSGGNMLLVQPTVDDAAGFGRDQLVPILRESPTLAELFPPERSRDQSQTLRRKEYRGGILYLVGANSGTGFRRVLAPLVLLDEVDAYPVSAGDDGDPVTLAEQRGVTAWNRKIIACSTPLKQGASRIEAMFLAGDQRRFFVPCPQCGHMDFLAFAMRFEEDAADAPADERPDGRGHLMRFEHHAPDDVFFECSSAGCVIEEEHKEAMLAAGEWRATNPDGEPGHASFHIWAAYSPHPKASWGTIAREFVRAAKGGHEQQRVWTNTVGGETFREVGSVPDWERLYGRRSSYPIGSVPEGVEFLTCGIDVAPVHGRFDYEVVGWDMEKRSWSIESGEIYGPIGEPATWAKLDTLVARQFPRANGASLTIQRTAIDSGAATQAVYNWARRYGAGRVMTVKGLATQAALVSAGRPVDITVAGKVLKGGHRNFIVGTNALKQELYFWLRLNKPESGEYQPGWCHFPEYDEEYFRQLTAEQLVAVTKRTGVKALEWQRMPGRENHKLDCRLYARAAASALGLDRVSKAPPPPPPAGTSAQPRPASKPTGKASAGWVKGARRWIR